MEYTSPFEFESLTIEDFWGTLTNFYTSDSEPPKNRYTKNFDFSKEQKSRKNKKNKVKYEPLKPLTMNNKKLRLLVTTKCHNSCPMCCNKQFDLNNLPIVDRWDYGEIMLTGGEPLSSTKKVRYLITLIESIKTIQKAQGLPLTKVYVYTSTHHPNLMRKILPYVDGITYTPHNVKEVHTVINFNQYIFLQKEYNPTYIGKKSFKLNLFPDIKEIIERVTRLSSFSYWTIHEIQWMKDCPIPEGEDFRRIYTLY